MQRNALIYLLPLGIVSCCNNTWASESIYRLINNGLPSILFRFLWAGGCGQLAKICLLSVGHFILSAFVWVTIRNCTLFLGVSIQNADHLHSALWKGEQEGKQHLCIVVRWVGACLFTCWRWSFIINVTASEFLHSERTPLKLINSIHFEEWCVGKFIGCRKIETFCRKIGQFIFKPLSFTSSPFVCRF